MLGIGLVPLPCRAENGFVPESLRPAHKCATGQVQGHRAGHAEQSDRRDLSAEIIRAFADLAVESGAWLIIDETYRDFLDAAGARPHGLFNEPDLRAATDPALLILQILRHARPSHRRLVRAASPDARDRQDPRLPADLRAAVGQARWPAPSRRSRPGAKQTAPTSSLRARAFERALASSNGWRIRSIGAYFAYVEHPLRDASAPLVAKQLAERAGVLALPGTFFGGASQDRYLRFAFANVGAQSLTGIDRRLALAEVTRCRADPAHPAGFSSYIFIISEYCVSLYMCK